ncbi:MAG: fused MFS/spermidine synthase [Micavibrio sp.]|nr:fused MFS/spermidine synthase [Micavibrio sp.]
MKYKLYIPVFSFTLLLSAALLFSVQPLFSKMILPLLGGTPNVWNTAMLFFQAALLAGYAYAHGTTRFLGIRSQAILHFILLITFLIVLPLGIPDDWMPDVATDPTLWQLGVMTLTVGGPFFVLAASAPMLQRWFSNTNHKDADNPYFLYGASNLGSMGSLLLYPVLFEPSLTLDGQSELWMYGYIALIALIGVCALLVWKFGNFKAAPTKAAASVAQPVTWTMRAQWLVLAFIPSSLMLGVTTYITSDIASAPMIWIVPLAIYVGTFILVFAKKPLLNATILSYIQGLIITGIIFLLMIRYDENLQWMGIHLLAFTVTAWMCHRLLADKKPDSAHLTEFYLLMSVGGALGGLFNAIIAPQFFITAIEYPLVLAASCFCRFWIKDAKSIVFSKKVLALFALGAASMALYTTLDREVYAVLALCVSLATLFALIMLIDKRIGFAALATVALLTNKPTERHIFDHVLERSRNFFGLISVVDIPEANVRMFLHGVTNHGMQALEEEYKYTGISYYSPLSPLNDVFEIFSNEPSPQEVAIIGLGAGATACFTKEGRHFDFFEIDPAVVEVAEDPEYFTFLSDCGSPYDVILGDGRMTIQRMPDAKYDIILLDAFSSDNIPVHVLTEEAVAIYLSKLKEDGVIVFHISNKYLDLEPVVAQISKKLGFNAIARFNNGGTLEDSGIDVMPSHYAAISRDPSKLEQLKSKEWSDAIFKDGVESWSDQYSNIFSVLGNTTGKKRVLDNMDKNKMKTEQTDAKKEPLMLDQEAKETQPAK